MVELPLNYLKISHYSAFLMTSFARIQEVKFGAQKGEGTVLPVSLYGCSSEPSGGFVCETGRTLRVVSSRHFEK